MTWARRTSGLPEDTAPRDPDALERLVGNLTVYSQVGQDFWVYAEAFNGRTGGYFVDIGAHDGVAINNTYVLERDFGWSGLLIEANPKSFARLVRNRTSRCLNLCMDRNEGMVSFQINGVLGGIVDADLDNAHPAADAEVIPMETRRLIDVLDEAEAPSVIDYLSVDVEGAEDRVLGGFDHDRYRFNCMTIERPGAALREELRHAGYHVARDMFGLDLHYVHESFIETYRQNTFRFYKRFRRTVK